MSKKILAAALCLCLALCICGCDDIFYTTPEFSVSYSEYEDNIMPDLTGVTLEEANENALEYKLNPIESYSVDYEEGVIFEQSIKAGETVALGAVVDVYVSKGARYEEVPVVSSFTYQVAKTVLESVGFEVEIVYEGEEGSCDDSINSISPEEGTNAVYGSVVTIRANALEPSKIKTTTTEALARDGTRPATTKLTY
ncbi:MAG: PASTA domain-containing protein [Ruminococcus sp.]|nr:PASTA domain-containing protein [Ruminococcus sp.]